MVKRKKAFVRLVCCLLAAAALVLLCVYALRDGLTVSEYEVSPENLPAEMDGFRIALIADLHCARFGENQSELCGAVRALSPDLVVLCGDILDSTLCDFEPVEELLRGLSGLTVAAVYGNHENSVSYYDRAELAELYEKYGVTLLSDDSVILTTNGVSFCVSGAADPSCWGKNDLEYVREHLPQCRPADGMFNLLLCHRANIYPALSGLGFDLVLSGHLHGGQIRIPFVGGLISPSRELFPDYTSGVYSENGSLLVVSRGLGNSIKIPRVFNPPELVSVVLRAEKRDS